MKNYKLTNKNKRNLRRIRAVMILIIPILLGAIVYPNKETNNMPFPPRNEINSIITESIVKSNMAKDTIEGTNNYNENIPLDEELQNFIYSLSEENEINPNLIYAMIKCESNFNEKAVGINKNSKDVGILQINNINHEWGEVLLGKPIDYYNSYDNIEVGIAIYTHYRSYWENKGYEGKELKIRALNSYNFGLSGYKKYIAKGNSFNSWYYANRIIKVKTEMESGVFELN